MYKSFKSFRNLVLESFEQLKQFPIKTVETAERARECVRERKRKQTSRASACVVTQVKEDTQQLFVHLCLCVFVCAQHS